MLCNHKLAKCISDISRSSFVTKLQYKAETGTDVRSSRWKWFPSSKIYSECGHKDEKKPLNIQDWICPIRHTHHDRDINASKNILTEGL